MLINNFDSLDIENLRERVIKNKTKAVERILDESYGSFKGQFASVKEISDLLSYRIVKNTLNTKSNNCEIEEDGNIVGVGKVHFKVIVEYNKMYNTTVRGCTFSDGTEKCITLKVNVNKEDIVGELLSLTIAHEIMHCFQYGIKDIKGINEKSAILYSNVLKFYNLAPTIYSGYFFYGLYICFSIEVSANVSSISNYMDRYFNGRLDLTTNEIMEALKKNEVYCNYLDMYNFFKDKTSKSFSKVDLNYIKDSLTTPMKDDRNGKYISIYDRDTFNVEKYVDITVKRLSTVCRYTMEKMKKNVMNYIDVDNR